MRVLDNPSDHDLLIKIDGSVGRLEKDMAEVKGMVVTDHDRLGDLEGEVKEQVARLDGRINAARIVQSVWATVGAALGALLPWNK